MQRKVSSSSRGSNTRAYRRFLKKKPPQHKDEMDASDVHPLCPTVDFTHNQVRSTPINRTFKARD